MTALLDMLFGSDEAKRREVLQIADDLTKVIVDRALVEVGGKAIEISFVVTVRLGEKPDAGR